MSDSKPCKCDDLAPICTTAFATGVKRQRMIAIVDDAAGRIEGKMGD